MLTPTGWHYRRHLAHRESVQAAQFIMDSVVAALDGLLALVEGAAEPDGAALASAAQAVTRAVHSRSEQAALRDEERTEVARCGLACAIRSAASRGVVLLL